MPRQWNLKSVLLAVTFSAALFALLHYKPSWLMHRSWVLASVLFAAWTVNMRGLSLFLPTRGSKLVGGSITIISASIALVVLKAVGFPWGLIDTIVGVFVIESVFLLIVASLSQRFPDDFEVDQRVSEFLLRLGKRVALVTLAIAILFASYFAVYVWRDRLATRELAELISPGKLQEAEQAVKLAPEAILYRSPNLQVVRHIELCRLPSSKVIPVLAEFPGLESVSMWNDPESSQAAIRKFIRAARAQGLDVNDHYIDWYDWNFEVVQATNH